MMEKKYEGKIMEIDRSKRRTLIEIIGVESRRKFVFTNSIGCKQTNKYQMKWYLFLFELLWLI